MLIRTDPAADGESMRSALYTGDLFLLPANKACLDLGSIVWGLIEEEFGEEPRMAHAQFSDVAFFEAIGRIRKVLYTEARFHRLAREVIAASGVDPERSAFDPLRLRVIAHGGHKNVRAKAVYYPHRDTWYAHSNSIVTHWIALHDVAEAQTFNFYPERFDVPVPNDSEVFDYDDWVARGWDQKIGWQNRDDGLKARYPGLLGDPELGEEVGFSCKAGQQLLFSGAHLHGTRQQSEGTTRFSLDFRVVDLDDHRAGRGAPNVDNRSTGAALPDYVHPPVRP